MIIQGQVGPITSTTSIAAGTQATARLGQLGDLIASELHGRYYEQAYRRNIYSAGNQAAVATVALGTTNYTGLVLSNPIGATVNLVLLKGSYANSVAVPTAGYLGIETGYNSSTNVTHTSAATVYNHFIGVGSAGAGLVDTAANTLSATPVHRMSVAGLGTVANTGYGVTQPNIIDFEGSIILPPGAFIAWYTSATNTAAWFFTWMWEEVPV